MSRKSKRRSWEILQETMEMEYSKELLASKTNRTVNWNFARNAVQRLDNIVSSDSDDLLSGSRVSSENYLHPEGKFWKTFEFLMNSFDTMNLPDTTIAADLFRLAYRSLYFEQKDFPNCITDEIRSAWYLDIDHREFRRLLKAAYSGYEPDLGFRDIDKVVWHFIARGKEKALSSLLRYGIMFVRIPVDDNIAAITCLLFDNRDEPDGWIYEWIYRDSWSDRMSIVRRVIQLLALEMDSKKWPPGRGPYLEQCAEDCTLSRSVYFRCLQRTFETIPEPFVTSDEIRCYLREMLGIYLDEEGERHIDRLIAEFEDLYPEGAAVLSPRSLKHLSRCQVREELRQSGTLPHGVREWGLPRNIEKYIILE